MRKKANLRSVMPVRSAWIPLGASLVLGALAGVCHAAGTQGSTSLTHLTISYSEKVGDNIPLWIAEDAGYFKKEGLDPTVMFIPSRQGIPALLSGQVQMAAIGGSDGVSAAAQGAELKYVATFSPVYTFQFWARPQYAKASALKGQRIGTTSTTGSVYAATVVALKQLGMSVKDVAITPLGTVPNVDSALLAGSIAAAASHPPATYEFKKHGFVDLVDLAGKRTPAVNTGLIALTPFIKAHGDVVQHVVNAIVQGLKREKADKAFTESEIRKHIGVTDQAVLDFTYNFYAKEVAPDVPLPTVEQLDAAKQALSAGNPKVKALDLSKLVDQSFVHKAAGQQTAK